MPRKLVDTEKRKLEIGNLVRAAREARGLSRTELGRLIGYDQPRCDTCVANFETGRNYIPPERMRAVKKALGLTWDDIIP